MKDALGVDHAPCAGVMRIACLVPSITELLFALDLDEYVVARTGFCTHPAPQVLDVPKIGGTKDVNIKKLLGLRPTHVIVNIDENRRETVDEIAQSAPQVSIIVTHPCAPEDNAALYTLLGFIFNRDAEAGALCAGLHGAIADARAAVAGHPRERVLYLIWKDPWMTVGRETYIARTLALIGWDCAQPVNASLPAAQIARYPTLAESDACWQSVDHILLSTEPFSFSERNFAQIAALANRALRPPTISLIDGEWTSWYGVRAISSITALAQFRQQSAALQSM